jgi:hypothetical protein
MYVCVCIYIYTSQVPRIFRPTCTRETVNYRHSRSKRGERSCKRKEISFAGSLSEQHHGRRSALHVDATHACAFAHQCAPRRTALLVQRKLRHGCSDVVHVCNHGSVMLSCICVCMCVCSPWLRFLCSHCQRKYKFVHTKGADDMHVVERTACLCA